MVFFLVYACYLAESVGTEYRQMVESVSKAWALVGDKLRDHGRTTTLELYSRLSFLMSSFLTVQVV